MSEAKYERFNGLHLRVVLGTELTSALEYLEASSNTMNSPSLAGDWRFEVTADTNFAIRWALGILFYGTSSGIGALLFAITWRVFINAAGLKTPTKASRLRFGVILFGLLAYQAQCILSLRLACRWLRPSCPFDNEKEVGTCVDLGALNTDVEIWFASVLGTFNQLLGDYMVVHRARALCRNDETISYSLLVLLISVITTGIYHLAAFTPWARNTTPAGNSAMSHVGTAYNRLSLITNLFAMISVLLKLWRHRQFLEGTLGLRRRQTYAQRVLTIIVDSGIVFGLLQIINNCSIWLNLYGHQSGINRLVVYWVLNMGQDIFTAAPGLYPAIVLACVRYQELHEMSNSVVEFGTVASVEGKDNRNGQR